MSPAINAKPLALVVVPKNADELLTEKERKAFEGYECIIEAAAQKLVTGFLDMAAAFHEIRDQRLYRASNPTFAGYFNERWNFGRSHANRIADAGESLSRLSPRGDILDGMSTEAHFRPLASLTEADQQSVVDLAQQWRRWRPNAPVEPSLLRSARSFLNPPTNPASPTTPYRLW